MSLKNLFCGFHGLSYIKESHASLVLTLFSHDFPLFSSNHKSKDELMNW